MFDIFLDCGVIPPVVQSDLGREFMADVTKELITLLGSSQTFSSAFHPQSQGIVDMLTELQSKFVKELAELEDMESNAKNAYDMITQDLTQQTVGKSRIWDESPEHLSSLVSIGCIDTCRDSRSY